MKNMVQRGHSMTVTATAAVKSGDLILSGAVPGVAYTDAANGELFEVSTDGVFDLPKAAGAVAHRVDVDERVVDIEVVDIVHPLIITLICRNHPLKRQDTEPENDE